MLARIKEELQTERERYMRTKYGKIAALGIYYALFTYVPVIINKILPSLLERVSQELAFILVVFGAMFTVGLLLNIFMVIVYKIKHPFFEQYRVDSKRAWPWQQKPKEWHKMILRTVGYNIINICILSPVLFYLDAKKSFIFSLDMINLPSFMETAKYLIVWHIMEDLFFFSTHWLLHTPFLYKNYNTTIAPAGIHFHIVQFLLANSIPAKIYLAFTAWLFGPIHVTTVTIWMMLRVYDAYSGHSGYIFSWTPLQLLPFCTNDDFHDFHHSHNCGNFGSQFRYLDSIFGTNQPFRDFKKKQKLIKQRND